MLVLYLKYYHYDAILNKNASNLEMEENDELSSGNQTLTKEFVSLYDIFQNKSH
jgi:hypothetical protein